MKSIIYILLLLFPLFLMGQQDSILSNGTNLIELRDTNDITVDSTLVIVDTLIKDSLITQYTISEDAVSDEIEYGAIDSNWTSIANKEVHLYGDAYINYQDINIKADYIKINFAESTVFGYAKKGINGKYGTLPTFVNGATEASFLEMKYNFKTKKAFVHNITTNEGEFFLLGNKSKFVSKDADTLFNHDVFYNQNALITTCNLPHPHFGIRTSKLKLVPNQLAIVGPSQLELFGVPTPLVLPFGFFPLISGGQSAGLIFPSSYDYNERLGFGFREIGYYFPINDHIDAKLTGDIYTRGTYAVRLKSNYKKRYGYSGNFGLDFNNNRVEGSDGKYLSNKSFSIRLSHTQDRKAHPYRTIGGSINISTNLHDQRAFNDAQTVLKNTLTSNFTYNYKWPDSPFKFSMGLAHNQNNTTRQVNLTLPTAKLTMSTIQPFKRKDQIGDQKWFEKINLGYNADMKNFVRTTDTTLFTQATLDNLQTGLSHSANISTNFQLFKYINVSPSIRADEIYFLRTLDKTLDPKAVVDSINLGLDSEGNTLYALDTTAYGTVVEEFVTGFKAYRKANASISMNTTRFFTKTFKKGLIRGIRHVSKPSLTLNYSPDTEARYYKYVDDDTRDEFNDPDRYNPFSGGVYSTSLSRKQFALNWGVNHIFEGKYWSKKDSLEKKLKLFNNIRLNGGYNFAADSLKWSDIRISGNTKILKGITNFRFSASATPYQRVNGRRRINKLLIDEEGRLLDLASLNFGFSTGITVRKLRDIIQGKDDNKRQKGSASSARSEGNNRRPRNNTNNTSGPQSFVGMFDNFRITHNLDYGLVQTNEGRDSIALKTHSLRLRGSIKLSSNWGINVGNIGYDFKSKGLVYPSFSFTRGLHCWQMSFAWHPQRETYSFFIGVKSSALSFLKYNYGQRNAGALIGGNSFGPR